MVLFLGGSRFRSLCKLIRKFSKFDGTSGDYFRLVSFSLFSGFVLVRLSYVVGWWLLVVLTVSVAFSMYMSVVFYRMSHVSLFMSGFVCEGVPFLFGVVSCCVEVISYIIRPVVLLVRPLVNLLVGLLLSDTSLAVISVWLFGVADSRPLVFTGHYLLFVAVCFYEWCISCVQWYIIEEILFLESSL